MALDASVDSLDAVPEAYRGDYKEDTGTGKFVLDVNPKDGLSLTNTSELTSALGRERGLVASLNKKLAAFGDVQPDQLQDQLAKLAQLEQLDPEKEADKIAQAKVDAQVKQLVNQHKKDIQSIQDREGLYKNQLQKVLIDDAAKAAILNAGGDERTIAYMLPEVKRHLNLSETQQGVFKAEVQDSLGNPRIGDASGSAMTVSQLVEEMKAQDLWAGAFPGKNKSGGGRQSDGSGGAPGATLKKSDMSRKDKAQFIAEHGHEKYMQLPK